MSASAGQPLARTRGSVSTARCVAIAPEPQLAAVHVDAVELRGRRAAQRRPAGAAAARSTAGCRRTCRPRARARRPRARRAARSASSSVAGCSHSARHQAALHSAHRGLDERPAELACARHLDALVHVLAASPARPRGSVVPVVIQPRDQRRHRVDEGERVGRLQQVGLGASRPPRGSSTSSTASRATRGVGAVLDRATPPGTARSASRGSGCRRPGPSRRAPSYGESGSGNARSMSCSSAAMRSAADGVGVELTSQCRARSRCSACGCSARARPWPRSRAAGDVVEPLSVVTGRDCSR